MKNYFLLSLIGILFPILIYAQGWTPQATGFFEKRGLWDISIADENTVWALAYDGNLGLTRHVPEFTKTTDGGITWTLGFFPFTAASYWANISAINADTAWIGINTFGGGDGAIYKTEDGGTNWYEQGGNLIFNSNSFLQFVYFWNATDGVAVGDPNPDEFEIYTTTNGGETWTPVPADSIPDPLPREWGKFRYCILGNNIWFATSVYRIYHSSDKGLTWSVSESGIPNSVQGFYNYIDIAFWNEKEGIARELDYTTGVNLNVTRTNDGGATWNPVVFTGPFFGDLFGGIAYVPGTVSTLISTALSRGYPKGSSYSNDGGTTWMLIDTNPIFRHYITRFLNPTTGWSADNTSDPAGGICKFTGTLVNVKNSHSGKEIFFGAYPNPSKGHITVQLNNGENADLILSVIDLTGRVVYKKAFGEPGEFFMRGLDLSSLAKGEYILKIENGHLNHSEQIIIQ
jgi:hypothetical protein